MSLPLIVLMRVISRRAPLATVNTIVSPTARPATLVSVALVVVGAGVPATVVLRAGAVRAPIPFRRKGDR